MLSTPPIDAAPATPPEPATVTMLLLLAAVTATDWLALRTLCRLMSALPM